MTNTIDRRSLIAGTVLTGATASGVRAAPGPRATWDHEFDMVIVGFGCAGISAAVEALEVDPKIKILILEKTTEALAGGNTRGSGQSLLIIKDKEALKRYQRAISDSNPIPEDMLEYWADQMAVIEPWIKERAKEAKMEYSEGDGAVYEFPEYGAEDAVSRISTILPRAGGLWAAFKANIDKRPVTVWYESPCKDLVQDPETSEVYGVIVERGGKREAVRARRGVLMACGGFENNPDMQRNLFGFDGIKPFGSPANTGDGLRMLMKAGADLWHVRNRTQSGGLWPAIKVPGLETVFMRDFRGTKYSWIEVAADNQRFGNETFRYSSTHCKFKLHGHYFDSLHYQVMPVHMIFDETVRKNDCLMLKWMTWNAAVVRYDWSKDNSAEVAKGWITQAATIGGLAHKIGRNADELQRTVNEYNTMCTAGEDTRFGRDPAKMQPIATPPY